MGTLAGSTIMLLTVPWSLSLFVASCNLNDLGGAIEKTRTYWSLTRTGFLLLSLEFFRNSSVFWNQNETGITVDADTRINARLMLISCASFFVVQIVAFWYLGKGELLAGSVAERPFAVSNFGKRRRFHALTFFPF
jgi:hypothetical protein